MDIRDRILQAAARVYAQHGFRGATTRLIAIEAGVNEVSLFRTFGSKAALFEAMTRCQCTTLPLLELPDVPVDPQRELTDWCAALLAQMRQARSMIRKSFGELEERPDAALSVCEGPHYAGVMLSAYVGRLQDAAFADAEADVETAVSMFMSTMFGDTIARDVMPNAFPQPTEEAPAMYVRTFLRAIGAPQAGGARVAGTGPRPASDPRRATAT